LYVQAGETALMKAAAAGHVSAVQLLVDAGANTSAVDQVNAPTYHTSLEFCEN
jgi:ankyrin repeat protein